MPDTGNRIMRKDLPLLLGLWFFAAPVLALSKADVRAIVQAAYPGARVTEVEKETYRGQAVWAVDFRHEGKKLEAILDLDGEILEVMVDD